MTTLHLEALCRSIVGVPLLHDVSLTFAERRINLLLGANGAGKTTLLRLCALLDVPNSGAVLQQQGQGPLQPPQRNAVTMVFQRPALFNRSVRANLDWPLRMRRLGQGEAKARMAEVMALADLEALAERPARTLSGGEAQRLAMARAMVIHPAVLLLDEPAANLDPASRGRIERMLLHMQTHLGTTVVMSTHDMAQARRLGEAVFFVHQGRVEGPYPPGQFFEGQPPCSPIGSYLSGATGQNP